MSLHKSRPLWIVLLALVTACHGRRPILPSQAPAAPAPVPAPAARPPAPPPAAPPPLRAAAAPRPAEAPPSDDELFRRKSLDQLNAERPLADVFFDFDEAVLRADDREALARDAHWLLRWKQTRIEVDGYCDERGTAEYNLALGERRARVARDYLIALGVEAARITTVSFGEERWFCRESTEACWAENRRGHFVITAK